MIDWCNRSPEQERRINQKPKLFWRLFQEIAHEVVHLQTNTLRIAYVDSIGDHTPPESYNALERVILQTKKDMGGTFFTPPPRQIEGLRLVQSAEAFCIEHGTSAMPHPFDTPIIRPVRVALLAYSAPGCTLDKNSFWSFDNYGQIALSKTEHLERLRLGRYGAGVHFGRGLQGLIERKKVQAITSSASYQFLCKSTDCHKCMSRRDQEEGGKEICNEGISKWIRKLFCGRVNS